MIDASGLVTTMFGFAGLIMAAFFCWTYVSDRGTAGLGQLGIGAAGLYGLFTYTNLANYFY